MSDSLPGPSRVFDWVGCGRDDWFSTEVGRVCREVKTSNKDMKESQVLSLSYGRVIVKPSERMSGLLPASFDTYQILEPGDIVIRPTDLQNDQTSLRVGQANDRGIITSAYIALRPTADMRARYLFRLLSAYDYMKVFYGFGAGLRQNLDFKHIRHIPIVIPTLPEQELIVRYLDNAELRIARAIQGKQQLAALLRERRRVLVEEVVLRGASDANAGSLVDSGVPWLGMVPESWSLTPFRGVFSPRRKIVGKQSQAFTLLSLTLNGVIVRDLSQLKGKFPASFDSYQEVRVGDLVMCLFDVDETPRTVGLSQHHGMITGAYDVFSARDALVARFSELQLLALDAGKKFKPLYRGLRKTVPTPSLAGARLCIPPRERIEGIVEALERRTKSTDDALSSLSAEIELLSDYRTRLISDVVSGKKDVRDDAAKMKDVDPDELASVLAGVSATEKDELVENTDAE